MQAQIESPDPGVESNARLTAAVGVLLFVLLAAEGVTILSIHRLLPAHYFIGLVLIPPVLLKLGTTGYKFVRYYTRNPRYLLAGPPPLALRLLGPLVVVSTVAVLGTGVELWLFGSRFGDYWLSLHKLSFLIWFAATAVHVLGHLDGTPRLVWRDIAGGDRAGGRITRGSVVLAALLLGLVLAIALLPWPSPFVAPIEQ